MFKCRVVGPRPARGTLRRHKRIVLALALCLLCACTRVELEDHSLQFNQATGSLGNRVMLLNVVRAAKGYPIQFSKVTGYSGNSRLDGNLNVTLPFVLDVFQKPASLLTGNAQPGATFRSGVSNLQLADLNTAEIQRTLRKPVSAADFAYYRSQGWPNALVNTILIEELFVQPELWEALKLAGKQTCAFTGSVRNRKREYQRVCDWIQGPTRRLRRCIEAGKLEQRSSPDGDTIYALPNDPKEEDQCFHERFQFFFAAIRVLPGASLDFDPKVDPEECPTPKALLKQLGSTAKEPKGKSRDAAKSESETGKSGKGSMDKDDRDDDASSKASDGGSIGLNLPRGLRALNDVTKDEVVPLLALRSKYLCLLKEGKTPFIINWRSPERMVRYLGVNFQEVVHSVRTGNADVARPQRFAGGPNEHPQQCSPHAQRSRGHGPSRCGPWAEQSRGRAPLQQHAQNSRQVGRPLPG